MPLQRLNIFQTSAIDTGNNLLFFQTKRKQMNTEIPTEETERLAVQAENEPIRHEKSALLSRSQAGWPCTQQSQVAQTEIGSGSEPRCASHHAASHGSMLPDAVGGVAGKRWIPLTGSLKNDSNSGVIDVLLFLGMPEGLSLDDVFGEAFRRGKSASEGEIISGTRKILAKWSAEKTAG